MPSRQVRVMGELWSRWLLCMGLLLLLLGGPKTTRAQGENGSYRSLIEQGIAEYDLGHFPEARALFFKAYELDANARVLRCLGMAEFELRNYRESEGWLVQALSSTVQPLTSSLRAETDDLLARARGFVTQLRISVVPERATVSIDGAPPEQVSERPVLLEAGDHALIFRAPGYLQQRHVLQARGGDAPMLGVVLRAEVLTEAAPPAAPPATDKAPHFFLVPRFTLTMPGKGSYRQHCTQDACRANAVPKSEYSRGAGAYLGLDVLYAVLPALRFGLGFHAQLNQTTWRFSSGYNSEFGRGFWIPAVAEYRVSLVPRLELPLRLLTGLTLVQAGRDLKRVGRDARTSCDAFSAQGLDCTVAGPPAAGVVLGVGPGLAFALPGCTLRGDLTLGYQWTRLVRQEVRGSSFSGTAKQTDGTFIVGFSIAAEL